MIGGKGSRGTKKPKKPKKNKDRDMDIGQNSMNQAMNMVKINSSINQSRNAKNNFRNVTKKNSLLTKREPCKSTFKFKLPSNYKHKNPYIIGQNKNKIHYKIPMPSGNKADAIVQFQVVKGQNSPNCNAQNITIVNEQPEQPEKPSEPTQQSNNQSTQPSNNQDKLRGKFNQGVSLLKTGVINKMKTGTGVLNKMKTGTGVLNNISQRLPLQMRRGLESARYYSPSGKDIMKGIKSTPRRMMQGMTSGPSIVANAITRSLLT
jgi:hypothetical protein